MLQRNYLFENKKKIVCLMQIPHSYVLISLSSLATLNIYGTVPHLSKVLTALVTLLPQIKTTVHRCHFSTTLAKFSEAVIFYLANIDRAPDPCIERLSFSEDVARAFEILFVQWYAIPFPIWVTH